MAQVPLINVVTNNGFFKFINGTWRADNESVHLNSRGLFRIESDGDFNFQTTTGNMAITNLYGTLTINAAANSSNALVISTSHANGGATFRTGIGGTNILSNGNIAMISNGNSIALGNASTSNLTMSSLNNITMDSTDITIVASDTLSLISESGDIQLGDDPLNPVIKFSGGNLLINQISSPNDYQVDIRVSDSSNAWTGYNGVMVSTSNLVAAADLSLRTTYGGSSGITGSSLDGGHLALGTEPLSSNTSVYKSYLAYQYNTMIVPVDGNEFTLLDVGRNVYWTTTQRRDTISELAYLSYVIDPTSTMSITVSTDALPITPNSRSYLYIVQIDSYDTVTTTATFKWSNDGGITWIQQLRPVVPTTAQALPDSNGISITFSSMPTTVSTQYIIKLILCGVVSNISSISTPETLNVLQPYHSYIKTLTPTDIVIGTADNEKARLTGDGAFSLGVQVPSAGFSVGSRYNDVLQVNSNTSGFQINPKIAAINSGGYVITWSSQESTGGSNYNIYMQRYMTDGTVYGTQQQVNISTANNHNYPSVAGSRTKMSNHFIITWTSNSEASGGSAYDIYAQVYADGIAQKTEDILVNTASVSGDQMYPVATGLGNGTYLVTWESNGAIQARVITAAGNLQGSIFTIAASGGAGALCRFPYVTGLDTLDPLYPSGYDFSISYLKDTAAAAASDDSIAQYEIWLDTGKSTTGAMLGAVVVKNNDNIVQTDGLQTIDYLVGNGATGATGGDGGGFMLGYYVNYSYDAAKHGITGGVANYNLYDTDGTTVIETGTVNITLVSSTLNQLTFNTPTPIEPSRPLVSGQILSILSVSGGVYFDYPVLDYVYTAGATGASGVKLNIGHQSIAVKQYYSNLVVNSLYDINSGVGLIVNSSPLFQDLEQASGATGTTIQPYKYQRPSATVCVDGLDKCIVSWTNGTIPRIYYRLIDIPTATAIGPEQLASSTYYGLKHRNSAATYLTSIQGNEYGFALTWDNQSLDQSESGIYQQLVPLDHSVAQVGNVSITHAGGMILTSPECTNVPVTSNVTASVYISAAAPSVELRGELVDGTPATGYILGNPMRQANSSPTIKFNDTGLIRVGPDRYLDGQGIIDVSSLLVKYTFEEWPSALVIDKSGSSLTGYLVSFDLENCYQANRGVLFDGIDDVIETLTPPASLAASFMIPNTTKTICMAIDPIDYISTNQRMSLYNNGLSDTDDGYFNLYLDRQSATTFALGLDMYLYNGTGNVLYTIPLSSAIVTSGTMTCIAATIYNSSALALAVDFYINNTKYSASTTAKTCLAPSPAVTKLYLGALKRGATTTATYKCYRGTMDAVCVLDRAISLNYMERLMSKYLTTTSAISRLKDSVDIGVNYSRLDRLGHSLDAYDRWSHLRVGHQGGYRLTAANISVVGASTTVYGNTGTSTFTTDVMAGDILSISGSEVMITEVISDAELRVSRSVVGTTTAYGGDSVYVRHALLSGSNIDIDHEQYSTPTVNVMHDGRVMIGVGVPASGAMLEVQDVGNTVINLTNRDSGTTGGAIYNGIHFLQGNTAVTDSTTLKYAHMRAYMTPTTDPSNSMVSLGVGAYDNIMMIRASNKIGIGSGIAGESPAALLHLNEVSTTSAARLLMVSGQTSPSSGVFGRVSELGGAASNNFAPATYDADLMAKIRMSKNTIQADDRDGRIDFLVNSSINSESLKTRMCITSNGVVGIPILGSDGTTTLEVGGRISGPACVSSDGGGGTTLNLTDGLLAGYNSNRLAGGRIVVWSGTGTSALHLNTVSAVVSGSQLTTTGTLPSGMTGYNVEVYYPSLVVTKDGRICLGTYNSSVSGETTSVVNHGGSVTYKVASTAISATLSETDHIMFVDATAGAVDIALPAASGCIGREYIIIKTDSSGNAANLKDGVTTVGSTTSQRGRVTAVSNGSGWY